MSASIQGVGGMETGVAKKLCVIGDPVAHSKSPLLQSTMLKALGLNYVYQKERVPAGALAPWLARAKAEGYVGFNATMPHKEALVPLMDALDADAELYRSVNTVCIKSGKLYGYSTDGRGFSAALGELGVAIPGKRFLLLGAGGAAKAVALKLCQQGAAAVRVCNRALPRAEELCKLHPSLLTPDDFAVATLTRRAADCDVLVNCTGLGMDGVAAQFEDFSFLDALPREAVVCDLIYAPAETELLRRARALGHKTMNGLGMLIWQGIFALEHFTDAKIDGPAMAALLRTVL